MTSALQYTQMNLHRADDMRRSPDLLAEHWTDPNCRVVALHENKNLLNNSFVPVLATQAELSAHGMQPGMGSFLGFDSETPYFAVCCNDDEANQWCKYYPGSDFIDLRTAGPAIGNEVASLLAYARGLTYWQSKNVYCAKCGGLNELVAGGHTMQCTQCSGECFPRTDPAVIMMVEHTDEQGIKKCLLGRSPAWPEGCLSTLAGFVETGESLENAVIREVLEETGVKVVNPRYIASQPWPFPQSMMLGFMATAVSTEIILDDKELAEAHWFSASEVRQFGEWADQAEGPKLPRVDSIARLLINQWLG